jgi:UDP-GlcNAc3NAcA epimerase
MLELLKNCNLVVTDSGGLQKEAFFNKKHCIIAREETEWVELVSNGFAKIVGSNTNEIVAAFDGYQNSLADFSMNLYGNEVGEKMHESIVQLLIDNR